LNNDTDFLPRPRCRSCNCSHCKRARSGIEYIFNVPKPAILVAKELEHQNRLRRQSTRPRHPWALKKPEPIRKEFFPQHDAPKINLLNPNSPGLKLKLGEIESREFGSKPVPSPDLTRKTHVERLAFLRSALMQNETNSASKSDSPLDDSNTLSSPDFKKKQTGYYDTRSYRRLPVAKPIELSLKPRKMSTTDEHLSKFARPKGRIKEDENEETTTRKGEETDKEPEKKKQKTVFDIIMPKKDNRPLMKYVRNFTMPVSQSLYRVSEVSSPTGSLPSITSTPPTHSRVGSASKNPYTQSLLITQFNNCSSVKCQTAKSVGKGYRNVRGGCRVILPSVKKKYSTPKASLFKK